MNSAESAEMKRPCQSDSDRISSLPAAVIDQILTLLPIQVAARTAMLSRQWRHQWRNTPRLVFDSGFAKITEQDGSASDANKIIFNIYKALMLHDGPISEFVLNIHGLSPCDEIDLIVIYLSNKGIKKLALLFGAVSEEHDHSERKVHSSLFAAVELNCLQLEGGHLVTPPCFLGFSKLMVLQLVKVILPTGFFESFIPMCPLLEDLRITYCLGSNEFKLVAPRLKVFVFVGHINNFSFKCTPLLSVVSIEHDNGYFTEGEEPDFVAFFASLPALQQLYLNLEFIEEYLVLKDHIPHKLPTPLFHLRVLGLSNGTAYADAPDDRVLYCLLRSSFRLETLTIKIDWDGVDIIPKEPVVVELESEEYSEEEDSEMSCLRELKIEGSKGVKSELLLVKYVLETAQRLERIVIKPDDKLGCLERYKFLQEVTKYKRASRQVEVIYG
ncbi:F-box/FBD/LRR-repeat protein At1g13570 [Linum grandiflorum]